MNNTIESLEKLSRNYRPGDDFNEFLLGAVHQISMALDSGMTAIFMQNGDSYTLDAWHGIERGEHFKLSVLGGGNFLKTLSSVSNYFTLDDKMVFRTEENENVCAVCLESGFRYVIPLKVDGVVVGMIFVHSLDGSLFDGEFGEKLRGTLDDLARSMLNGKLNSRLIQESKRKSVLLELSERLSSGMGTKELLETILESLATVIEFNAAGIFLVGGRAKKVQYRAQVGYDKKALKAVDLKVGKGVVGWCIETRKPILVQDVEQEPRYVMTRMETGSELCVPLIRRRKVLGAFNVENDRKYAYGLEDLEMLTGFASIAAVTIDNARLIAESREKRQLERDIAIAGEIQKALLPKQLPEMDGVELAAVNIPSKTVGGDLCDFMQFASGMLAVAIGDVSGKGVPAAILMANLFAVYKGLARTNQPVETVVRRLNKRIFDSTDSSRYATFFYGVFDPKSRRFSYCNGGHNPPFVVRDGDVIHYLKEGGPAVGFVPEAEYKSGSIDLRKGDYVVLYTDGITESELKNGEEYGIERLLSIAVESSGATAEEMHDRILKDVKHHTSGGNHSGAESDDITLMILKVVK